MRCAGGCPESASPSSTATSPTSPVSRRGTGRRRRERASTPATKLILRHAEHDTVAIQDLARELAGDRLTVVASGSEAVAELGYPPEEVIAFGDYANDVPLLAWAGRGVAMGNAHAEVLAIADEVTTTNDEDGVALVLERLFSEA